MFCLPRVSGQGTSQMSGFAGIFTESASALLIPQSKRDRRNHGQKLIGKRMALI
jgi:hypothetical protein